MKNCTPASQNSAPTEISARDLSNAAQGWLLTGEIAGWSDRTLTDRRWWLDRLQTYLTTHDLAFDLNGLRAFFLAIQKGTDARGRKPLKPGSIKHARTLFTAFGNWCVAESMLQRNPMERIPSPALRDDGIDPFTDEELGKLLEAAKKTRNGLRDAALVHFLADTGARASELSAVRLEDVDLTAHTAMIVCGKGGKGRKVAFGKATAQALWRYLRSEPRDPDDFLFTSERGGPMNRGSLLQLCRRLGKDAGVRGVHPHRFRHDCAVRLLRNGGHAFGVMAQLGHSRIQTTQVYIKLAERDVRDMQRIASPMDYLKGAKKR